MNSIFNVIRRCLRPSQPSASKRQQLIAEKAQVQAEIEQIRRQMGGRSSEKLQSRLNWLMAQEYQLRIAIDQQG